MPDTTFRGTSGEVVVALLRPANVLAGVPVAVTAAAVGAAATWCASRVPGSGATVVAAAAITGAVLGAAPFVGLAAVPQRTHGSRPMGLVATIAAGGMHAAATIACRFAVLSIAWALPAGFFLSRVMAGHAAAALRPAVLSPVLLLALGFAAALVVVGPVVSLCVAASAHSAIEVLTGRAWLRGLRQGGGDLYVLACAWVGGTVVLVAGCLPVLALLLLVASAVPVDLAGSLRLVAWSLPLGASPLLLGRLVGAYIRARTSSAAVENTGRVAERSAPVTDEREAATIHGSMGMDAVLSSPCLPPAQRTTPAHHADEPALTVLPLAGVVAGLTRSRVEMSPAREAMPATRSSSRGVPLGVALARAHEAASRNVEQALADVHGLFEQNPRNPAVLAELAGLLRRTGRKEEARSRAADAIRLALVAGAGPIAHDVFRTFWTEAHELGLDAPAWDQLGRLLATRRDVLRAAWCFRACVAVGGDRGLAEKELFGLAENAERRGERDEAAMVFQALAESYPDSRFAREAAERALAMSQPVPAGV